MTARHRSEWSLAGVIVCVAGLLVVVAPRFFQLSNLVDLLLANLPVLIVAVGALLVILCGEIDISVGSAFAVASVFAGTMAASGVPMPFVAVSTLVLGAVMGALNGALVAYARIPSIVVTLAAMVALRDSLRWITQGVWVQGLPATFQWFGMTQRAFPAAVLAVALVIALAAAWMLRYTRAGRTIVATGSNAEAARLAAIDTARVRFAVFVAAGVCTAVAALVNAARFSQIPTNTGLGLEMKVIAAVVVGGAAITGGRGSMIGTVLGVVLLGMSGPALTFLGASAYWERALQGAIILAAVVAAAWAQSSSRGRVAHGSGARRGVA